MDLIGSPSGAGSATYDQPLEKLRKEARVSKRERNEKRQVFMTGKEKTGKVARIMEFLPASSSCTVGGKRMRNIPRNAIAK